MDPHEFDLWLDMVDRMLLRLRALQRAVWEEGVSCRDPRVVVTNEEVRALDLLGLRLLRERFPADTRMLRMWHVHEEDECRSIPSSIERLRANRDTLRTVVRLYVREVHVG